MPTASFEIDEIRREVQSPPIRTLPARTRIGSGVALATLGGPERWKENPHHWQTLILLVPLFHNPDQHGCRRPISEALLQRTIDEMHGMFSGYTVTRATGWYWDEVKSVGVSDDLVRFEVDGVFTGSDLHALLDWKKKLRRRFKQDFIYMRLVPSGLAV